MELVRHTHTNRGSPNQPKKNTKNKASKRQTATEARTLFGLRGGSKATHPTQWKGREALFFALTVNSAEQGVARHLTSADDHTISSQAFSCQGVLGGWVQRNFPIFWIVPDKARSASTLALRHPARTADKSRRLVAGGWILAATVASNSSTSLTQSKNKAQVVRPSVSKNWDSAGGAPQSFKISLNTRSNGIREGGVEDGGEKKKELICKWLRFNCFNCCFSWQRLASWLPLTKFCYGRLHRRTLAR